MLRYLLCVILLVLVFVIAHQLILKKSNREIERSYADFEPL